MAGSDLSGFSGSIDAPSSATTVSGLDLGELAELFFSAMADRTRFSSRSILSCISVRGEEAEACSFAGPTLAYVQEWPSPRTSQFWHGRCLLQRSLDAT